MARFCGLAKRDYFDIGPYCNNDCFTYYIQKFSLGDDITLTTRRRGSKDLHGSLLIDKIAITIPVHCNAVREVSLDDALLKALTDYDAESKSGKWARWENSIACFNIANTDADNTPVQVEWILLCSAFQHLLGAPSNAQDIAKKFTEAMVPCKSLSAPDANRQPTKKWNDRDKSLRYEWMCEFYRIRGNFAHGEMTIKQPAVWNSREHMLLATIAFPLLIRSLLQKENKYLLTDDDIAQINIFEQLADKPFMERLPNTNDSVWLQLIKKNKLNLMFEKFEKSVKARRSGVTFP